MVALLLELGRLSSLIFIALIFIVLELGLALPAALRILVRWAECRDDMSRGVCLFGAEHACLAGIGEPVWLPTHVATGGGGGWGPPWPTSSGAEMSPPVLLWAGEADCGRFQAWQVLHRQSRSSAWPSEGST